MRRFSDLHSLNIRNLPDERIDSSIGFNLNWVSDFTAFEYLQPIWDKNNKGNEIELTTGQIGATGKVSVIEYGDVYVDYDASTLDKLLYALDIWVDASANQCASCGFINENYDVSLSSQWECSSCGYENHPWHYGWSELPDASLNEWGYPISYDQLADASIEVLYKSPFRELDYICLDYLPDRLFEGKIKVNRNSIVHYEAYKMLKNSVEVYVYNPIVYFNNNKGVQQEIRPSQVNAGSRLILRGGKSIFTPYTKEVLLGILDLNGSWDEA